jgi:hypothetical protein
MQRLRSLVQPAASRYAVVSFKSLALWRILLGATCTHVVLRRWGMLEVFYAGEGAYPVAALGDRAAWVTGPLRWLSGVPALHAAFALGLLITLAFTLGLWTRVVKWLLLPVLFSLDARAPALFTGGELVLHLQALYAWFFPLGRVLSADDWLARRARRQTSAEDSPTAIRTFAYPLVLLQLSVIYLFNALAKDGATWQDGTAVARALGASTLVSDFGAWAARLPDWVLRASTHGTLIIEGALPALLLSPWYRRYTHGLAAVLLVSLHGGIWLAMEVGSFSLAMMCHVPLLWHPRAAEERVEVPTTRRSRGEALAVLALTYLLAARLSHDLILFPKRPLLPLPDPLNRVSHALGLWQGWMMFSPNPPERDFVIVTDAVTQGGQHFDPWRQLASDNAVLLKELPVSVAKKHAFTRYENSLSERAHTSMHPFFARWVLRQRLGDDPVERFDAWLMVIPTDPKRVLSVNTLDAQVGVMPLPLADALPVAAFQARGVWAPERAFDRKIVPEGTHVFTPVSATMSAGCPSLTIDLGHPKSVQSAYFQADAADQFSLEGSFDGTTFRSLGEMPKQAGRQHRSRIVPLSGEPVRFVRLRPTRSRGFRHILSEVGFFDRPISMPPLPERPVEKFVSSLARPTVVGIISGTNHPTPDCPAEDPARYPAPPSSK